MSKFRSAIEFISNMLGYFSGWLVVAMTLLILVEVFMRYVLHNPPLLADEFSAYMLIAMSYLGGAYTFKEKGHVRITAFVTKVPEKVASWLRVFTLSVALAFSIALTWSAIDFMRASFRFHYKSATWLNFPLQGPQMTVLIGFAMVVLILLIEIIKTVMDIRAGKYIKETLS